MAAEYATQAELDLVRADVRAVWSAIKDVREDISELKSDIREIKTLLTERCATREANIERTIRALEQSSAAFQASHQRVHANCSEICHEMEERISSLERTRIWMLGASAAIGAVVGVVAWGLTTWVQHFKG